MTHVTRRPFPRGASGIGTWQFVFEKISSVAIVVNVLLLVFVMHPMRSWPLQTQLGIFIVLEHVLLGIRSIIDVAIPDEPLDVRRIDDFNAHFRKTMVKYPPLEIPPRERYTTEYHAVDLGLLPAEGLDTEMSAGSTSNSADDDSEGDERAPCCRWP